MTVHRQTGEIIALILLFLGITLFTVLGLARDWMPAVVSHTERPWSHFSGTTVGGVPQSHLS